MRTFLTLVCLASTLAACTAQTDGGTLTRRPSSSKGNGTTGGDTSDPEDDSPGGTTTPADPGGTTTPAPTTTPGNDTPAAPPSSKGSGGPTGQSTLKSTGGLSYIINVPQAAPTKPRGLLVLLHGSGASNYQNFINMMATVATAQDLIRVSVLAPNGQGWNEGNQTTTADLLHKAIQQDILPKYDIALTRIVFSGQSSGGGFLSSHFLPLHAKDYRGGAFMQCGAAPPVPALTPDAATKAGFRLHFEITTGDTIWPTSYKNAVAAYTTAGMSLTKDDTKSGGHCQFDQQAVIQAHIATILP